MQHDGSRRKAMGFMPMVRMQNTLAAITENGIEVLSAVLPQVQAGMGHQREKFHH